MKKICHAVFAFSLLLGTSCGQASVLYWNGDPVSPEVGVASEYRTDSHPDYFAPTISEIHLQYADFTLSSDSIINNIFGDFYIKKGTVTMWVNGVPVYADGPWWNKAYWEIRQNITPGDPGTLVAGGFFSDASRSLIKTYSNWEYDLYRYEISNFIVPLSSGTYYLTLAPNSQMIGTIGYNADWTSYAAVTNGDNSLGSNGMNNGYQSSYYINNNSCCARYESHEATSNAYEVSFGLSGNAQSNDQGNGLTIPEPSTIALFGLALFTLGVRHINNHGRNNKSE